MASLKATVSNPSGLFAAAVDNFLEDVAKKDAKGPFYQAVTELRQRLNEPPPYSLKPAPQSQRCADELREFIRDLETKKKRSTSLKIITGVEPLVTSLLGVASTCEDILQANPFAIGVIFAGARVLLTLSVKLQETLDCILDALAEIDLYLRCYERIAVAHQHSRDTQLKLIRSYENVLRFWWKSTKLLSEKALVTVTKGLFRPLDQEIKECLRAIQTDRETVQFLVVATEAELNHDARLDKQRDVADTLRERLVRWIMAGENHSKLDVRHDLEDRLAVHHPGTCSWIFEHPDYQRWYRQNKDSTLWYNASAGCGKTMLASQVIQRLRQDGRKIVWYFYSFSDPVRRHPMTAFRSIALQLLRMTAQIPDSVKAIFYEEMDNFSPELHHPRTLGRLIHELLKITNRVHIVIDGLDESLLKPREGEWTVLDMINHLVLSGPERYGVAQWFFTSRNEGPIGSAMKALGAIELTPPHKNLIDDINAYLKVKLEGKAPCSCRVKYLTKESDGNFLYAKFRSDTMLQEGLTSEEDVEEELRSYPKGLTGCYLRSLESLEARPQKEQDLARRTLRLVVAAMQPLSVPELLDALAIRADSDDFSSKRLPRESLIQELCGSFIKTRRSPHDPDAPAVVTLCHKSVQDLFFSDPDELGVAEHLRKYFLSPKEASEAMGRACLTYLRYKRYHIEGGLPGNFASDPEHAFLRYAAVFWFQHLDECDKPDSDLRSTVRDFLKSPAFWNCLRVQTHVAPYLFARYANVAGCGYKLLGQGSKWGAFDSIASPIPAWFDDEEGEDRKMVLELHRYLLEWHEALASGRDALTMCPMDPLGIEKFPGRVKFQDKTVKRPLLGCSTQSERGQAIVDQVTVTRGVFKARVLRADAHDSTIRWCSSTPFSKQNDASGSLTAALCATPRHWGHLSAGSFEREYGAFCVDLKNLVAYVTTSQGNQISKPPDNLLHPDASVKPPSWSVVGQTYRCDVENTGPRAVALQLSSTPQLAKAQKEIDDESDVKSTIASEDEDEDEEEDEYDEEEEEDEEEESDDTEDSDSQEQGSEDSDTSRESKATTVADCQSERDILVILRDAGPPIWVRWPADTPSTQTRGAFHPTRPIFMWTVDGKELGVVDLVTSKMGETKTLALPKPQSISEHESFSSAVRELYISKDGTTLWSLNVLFEAVNEEVTRASVSLSAILLPGFDDNHVPLGEVKPTGAYTGVTYHFYKPTKELSAPYSTTHWTEDAVYLLLPLSTRSAKVLRMTLADNPEVQTMTRPIFIPRCAAERHPILYYHSRPSKSGCKPDSKSDDCNDSLYLSISATPNSRNETCGDASSNDKPAGPPTVIRWNVAKSDGWKAWDAEQDGKCEDLKRNPGISTWDLLRGSFVDSSKSFSVPIRGALDFRRKAFLSCG